MKIRWQQGWCFNLCCCLSIIAQASWLIEFEPGNLNLTWLESFQNVITSYENVLPYITKKRFCQALPGVWVHLSSCKLILVISAKAHDKLLQNLVAWFLCLWGAACPCCTEISLKGCSSEISTRSFIFVSFLYSVVY